jgi:cytochrome c553
MPMKTENHNPGFPMRHLLLALFLSVALIGCSDQSGPDKQTAEDIRVGRGVAERECKGCHGLDGKGVAPGIPNLAGQRGRYIMAALQEYKESKRVHAALRAIATDLSEDQTRGVAAFYASLKPMPAEKIPVFSPYEHGKTAAAACAPCHGADGNSKIAGTPNLAGQQPIYFVTATQEYLTGRRASAPMDPMLRKLTRLDIESVALFFASQTATPRPAPPRGNPTLGEPRTAVCGGCHGSHGVSTDTATPSLAGQDPDYLTQAIKGYRTTRKNDTMSRVVVNLSDQEIDDISAFYATQKSKPAEDGQHLLKDITDKCNRCHAGDINNPALAIPIINAQDKDYLVLALRSYRDGKRGSSLMHNMSVPYSDAIIESIASYYASLPAK